MPYHLPLLTCRSARFLPDGRAQVSGFGAERITLQRCWVEDGTDGLWYASTGSSQLAASPAAEDPPVVTGTSVDTAAQPLSTATTTSQRLSAAISIGAPAYNRGEVRCCCGRRRRRCCDARAYNRGPIRVFRMVSDGHLSGCHRRRRALPSVHLRDYLYVGAPMCRDLPASGAGGARDESLRSRPTRDRTDSRTRRRAVGGGRPLGAPTVRRVVVGRGGVGAAPRV